MEKLAEKQVLTDQFQSNSWKSLVSMFVFDCIKVLAVKGQESIAEKIVELRGHNSRGKHAIFSNLGF